MALLIKNGRIITASADSRADIYCAGETITRIEAEIDPASVPDAEIIDATGKYVFPGFIDPHVHIYLPFMGTYAKDDYESASKAALVGGTTTLDRDDLSRPHRRAPRGVRDVGGQGAGAFRVRLQLPHGGEPVRRISRATASGDRAARHRVVQGLPRVQGGARGERRGALPHAPAGKRARGDRDRPLRERDADRRACSTSCWRRARAVRNTTRCPVRRGSKRRE